jgi:hypothetical protein
VLARCAYSRWLLLLLTAAVLAGTSPIAAEAAAGPIRPRSGFWESSAASPDGKAASILVRRSRRRTVVGAVSVPGLCPRRSGDVGDLGVRLGRLRVDRRGRFAARRPTLLGGMISVRGRFRGNRRSALLRIAWRVGACRSAQVFRLRLVRRTPIPTGTWSGSHAGDGVFGPPGGVISFEVSNAGREAYGFIVAPPPTFRCSDGSLGLVREYPIGVSAWIKPDGSFRLRSAELGPMDSHRVAILNGSLRVASGIGSLRIIDSQGSPEGVCDTGTVGFSVRPVRAGPPSGS